MEIIITKGLGNDRIVVKRADGTSATTSFPKKGPVPHDVVHYFVERELELGQGFWGMVAGGRHPEEIAGIAKAAGHASASRAEQPDAAILELLQAERIVECFEADLWSGASGDATMLLDAARLGCETSHVPLPASLDDAVAMVRGEIGAFAREWIAAPTGFEARFSWE